MKWLTDPEHTPSGSFISWLCVWAACVRPYCTPPSDELFSFVLYYEFVQFCETHHTAVTSEYIYYKSLLQINRELITQIIKMPRDFNSIQMWSLHSSHCYFTWFLHNPFWSISKFFLCTIHGWQLRDKG